MVLDVCEYDTVSISCILPMHYTVLDIRQYIVQSITQLRNAPHHAVVDTQEAGQTVNVSVIFWKPSCVPTQCAYFQCAHLVKFIDTFIDCMNWKGFYVWHISEVILCTNCYHNNVEESVSQATCL